MPSSSQPFVDGSHQITYWECDKIYKQVMSFHVDGEQISLATRLPSSKTIWNAPFTKGAWHAFVLHVKWSPEASTGFVELWYEGKKVVDKTMVATQHRDPGTGAALNNFLHQGIFRGGDSIDPVEVMFLDGSKAGTSYDDVAGPTAPGDGGVDASDTSPSDASDASVDDVAVVDSAVDDVAVTDAGEDGTPSSPTVNDAANTALPANGGGDLDGCACTTVGAAGRASSSWIVAALAMLLLRRRR